MRSTFSELTKNNLFVLLKTFKVIWSTNPIPYRYTVFIEKFVQIKGIDGFSLVADAQAYDNFCDAIKKDIEGISQRTIERISSQMVWDDFNRLFDIDSLSPEVGEDIDLKNKINSEGIANLLSKLIVELQGSRANYHVYVGISGITKFDDNSKFLPIELFSYREFSSIVNELYPDDGLGKNQLSDEINDSFAFSDWIFRFTVFGDEHFVSDEGLRLANLTASLIVAFHKENISSHSYINQIFVGSKVFVHDPKTTKFMIRSKSEYLINADGITEHINDLWNRFSSGNSMDDLLKKAIITYGESCKISHVSWKFVMLIAALEYLLIDENERKGKKRLFSVRGSIILNDDLKFKDALGFLYDLRNSFIHGNKDILEKYLKLLDRFTKQIIFQLFKLNFSSIDKLKQHCDRLYPRESRVAKPRLQLIISQAIKIFGAYILRKPIKIS